MGWLGWVFKSVVVAHVQRVEQKGGGVGGCLKALWLHTSYGWGGWGCYGSLAAEAGVTHMHCNHAASVFVKAFRQRPYPSIQAHTGTVDALWKCLKDHMPASLCTRVQKTRDNVFSCNIRLNGSGDM